MGRVKILKASAGSGKTYRLAYEYVRSVIGSPWLYRNILAVTFTNKATEEMKHRILSEINTLAEGRRSGYAETLARDLQLSPATVRARAADARTKILHDYSHFTVITIDKFFQRIIRSFIKELGIDVNFNLELQTDSILESATDRLIEGIAVDRRLRDWVIRFVEEKIDQNGRWDIRSEISKLGQELFREQYRNAMADSAPKEELARITADAVARSRRIGEAMVRDAREALSAIASAGLSVEDFAYGRQGCVSYFVKTAAGEVAPYGKRVTDALASEEKWVSARSPHRDRIRALVPRLRDLLAGICKSYDDNIRFLNTTRLVAENYRSFALLSDLSDKVAQICTEQNLVPISETNTILSKLIGGNDAPFIYEKTGNAFSRFMIDEFQDTSMQQWQNFVPLLENATSQAEDAPVLLVGDVKQSIYRWRGGDWRILGHHVRERFGDPQQSTLDTNYRSLGLVVRFNNQMIGRCVQIGNDALNAMLDEAGSGADRPAEAGPLRDMLRNAYADQQQKCNRDADSGHVTIREYDPGENDGRVLRMTISAIEELQRRGFAAGDIAVLVRTNPQGTAIASALLDHKAAHPESRYRYDVVTQEALQIGNSAVAGFAVAVLRLAINGGDRIRLAVFNRFTGRPVDASLCADEAEFVRRIRLLPVEEAFEAIVQHYGLNGRAEHIAYLQALQEQIHTFSTSKIADIPLFLKWWDETGCRQSISVPQTRNAINILTIHKAKGLQYKAVILPYCNWSLLPRTGSLLWARGADAPFDRLGNVPVNWGKALENSSFSDAFLRETVLSHIDNINLFYVAATRAEEELHILLPRENKGGSQRISGLVAAAIETEADGTAAVGELRGTLSEEDDGRVIRFGTPVRHESPGQPASPETAAYPSRPIGSKLRFRLDSERYFSDDDRSPVLSPRSYGILMHKLFENIGDAGQIPAQLKAMRDDGQLSDDEAALLQQHIAKALSDPLIASWFDGKWTVVRNENAIVIPGETAIRRPDRVLTKGSEAVVIDYKFGQRKSRSHLRQIAEYMRLIGRMGYRSVRGYVWYVEREEVDTADV